MQTTPTEGKALLTTQEARQVIGVSRQTLGRLVAAGSLTPAFQLPGRTGAILFRRVDVEALAAARAEP